MLPELQTKNNIKCIIYIDLLTSLTHHIKLNYILSLYVVLDWLINKYT
jgi:hypothetical protein